MKTEELIKQLVDAGYKAARFLIISTKRVDLLVECHTVFPNKEKPDDEKASPHPEFNVPMQNGKYAAAAILTKNSIFARGKPPVNVLLPRIVFRDLNVNIGQEKLAPDAVQPEDVPIDQAPKDAPIIDMTGGSTPAAAVASKEPKKD